MSCSNCTSQHHLPHRFCPLSPEFSPMFLPPCGKTLAWTLALGVSAVAHSFIQNAYESNSSSQRKTEELLRVPDRKQLWRENKTRQRYLMSKNNTPEPLHALVMRGRSWALQVFFSSFSISAGADTQREVHAAFFYFFFTTPSIMLLWDAVSHFICHGLVRHAHLFRAPCNRCRRETRFNAASECMRVVKKIERW